MKQMLQKKNNQKSKDNLTQNPSLFKQKTKSHLFEFYFYIISAQKTNAITDALFVFIELCQLMSFPLHPRVSI